MSNDKLLARQAAAAAAMAAAGNDQTKVVTGGGDGPLPPPAEGFVKLRLVSYVEFGKFTEEYQGKAKTKNEAALTFELSGPKHMPRDLDDGTKRAQTMTVYVNLSQHEKAGWPKLFRALNYKGAATHVVSLIGDAYVANIFHKPIAKPRPGGPLVRATFINPDTGNFTIRAPRVEALNEETGDMEYKIVPVPPLIGEPKWFLFDAPTIEDWDSLFIDGTYEAKKDEAGNVTQPAKSKNSLQAKIISAKNFKGSQLEALLQAGGKPIDFGVEAEALASDEEGASEAPSRPATPAKPATPAVPQGSAADDLLNGIS